LEIDLAKLADVGLVINDAAIGVLFPSRKVMSHWPSSRA
jgi:hypothetical protein